MAKPLLPTDKQKELIRSMERRLKIPFEGKTRRDASEYIQEHYEEYKLYVREGYTFGKKKGRKNNGVVDYRSATWGYCGGYVWDDSEHSARHVTEFPDSRR